jgi:hypothetical protein
MAKSRTVIRTGNSLALTIPVAAIKQLNLHSGDLAQVKVNYPRASVTYIFSGHPRQLSLINSSKSP